MSDNIHGYPLDEALTKLDTRFEGDKLIAYRCPAGVLTIGRGHTNMAGGFKFGPGDEITKAQSLAIFQDDMAHLASRLVKLLKRQPTKTQWDAFMSLAYNIGLGAFGKSTALRRFNNGDDDGAASAILFFDKVRGKTSNGLYVRRRAEKSLFLSGHDAAHGLLDAAEYEKVRDDEGGAPQAASNPPPVKPLPTSKVAWGSVLQGGISIGAVSGMASGTTGAVNNTLDQAQAVHDTAQRVAGLAHLGPQFVTWGVVALSVAIVSGIVWDRWQKLSHDQV
jgi:lysozyme